MGKIKTIVIFAAGYVVGAKAGHQRYEQIKNWVQEMWGKPAVQEQVDNATEHAGKLAQEAKDRLPGLKNNDKDPADQNSTGSETDSNAKDSGQASDSTSKKADSTDSESKTTSGSPQKPTHG